MSIPTELARIEAAKSDMISALAEQGVSVPNGAPISDFGDYIRSIVKEGDGVDILSVYPIGSIYMSVNSTSPATLFGGTWEQLKDRFLLGSGLSYTAGATGGEATHKLTVNEMPAHVHKFSGDGEKFTIQGDTSLAKSGSTYPNNPGVNLGADWSSSGYITIGSAGGDVAHNNMPPYLAVYMWKRTA